MTEPKPRTLRIALALRGGVSLAVWIGGAVREIERLRTDLAATHADDAAENVPVSALARIADVLGYEKVEIDVVSGASAGGLNAVLLGRTMVTGASMDALRDIWLEDAAIANLLHKSSTKVPLSLLDGTYFLNTLKEQIGRLEMQPVVAAPIERLDVLLSVTSIVANVVEETSDPAAPVVDHHIDGVIHLRHRRDRSDFNTDPRDLALAARSTASFPVAFQPVPIQPGQLDGAIEFRPRRPDPLLLFDGGVVDNMPVDKAVRAITTAPADGPVARVLLYLHPSPGAPDSRAAVRDVAARAALARDGARPIDVLQSSTKALRSKSLADDLQALDAHNVRVDSHLRDRDRLLAPFVSAVASMPAPARGAVHALDAEQFVDLLIEPWDHVSAATTPIEPVPLLVGRSTKFLNDLRGALAGQLIARGGVPDPATTRRIPALARGSVRPWDPFIRSASLLGEWCRVIELYCDGIGPIKKRIAELREQGIIAAADLNVETLHWLCHVPHMTDVDTLATSMIDIRFTKTSDHFAKVADTWAQLGQCMTWLGHVSRGTRPSGTQPGLALSVLLSAHTSAGTFWQMPALDLLDSIDNVLLQQHRGRPTGSQDVIRYLTLSGAADTPLRADFTWPTDVRAPILSLKALRMMPETATTGDVPHIDPASKLAGNQLHNFAAFLARSWRANDWMWGQVDAASTIVDLLLTSDGTTWNSELLIDALGDLLCSQPLPESDGAAAGWSAEVKEAGTRLWTDAAPHVTAELASRDAASGIPPVTRSLLLWRRHVEIVATELARGPDDNPIGAAHRVTLEDSMKQWDNSSRRLSEKWGDQTTTALGMRALYVGWQVLFARVGAPLSWLRTLLSPIIIPFAGLALARRRASFAVAVFVLGCVIPRVHNHVVGRVSVAVLTVLISIGWLRVTRLTKVTADGSLTKVFAPFEAWSIATLVASALVVAEAIVIDKSPFSHIVPGTAGPASYIAPGLAIAIATFVTWYWAKWPDRIAITMLNSGIVCGWVYIGNHSASVHDWNVVGPLVNEFASFFWAVVALGVVSTAIGSRVDLVKTPANNFRSG